MKTLITSSKHKSALLGRFGLAAMSFLSIFRAVVLLMGVATNTAIANTDKDKDNISNQSPAITVNLPIVQVEECHRKANYSIYLSGLHTGTMDRTEIWQGQSAVITSISKASILGIGTQYHQRAELSWSEQTNQWLTINFHQKVSGFRSRDMQVTFNSNGLESRVNLDGDIDSYASTNIPLRDVDTLAIQMREHLLQGRQQFALIRQASDAMESYQYYVKPPQTQTIEPWGELSLIPVEQTGAEDITYYFAPSLDYQLVKARYHGIILQGVVELDSYSSTCGPISVQSR
ncbi:hypothetical protein [Shewanella donghaensis]|uniref:hypothetical protein n=1 Tax=Shewanella donghaensis TaxID=238836 RepID=UPI001D04D6B4|nr:hypothetical protein [Shewanella donghaensis]